jgi:hypothetical protein
MTKAQRDFLSQNGFVVMTSQEAQFNDIREEVAIRTGQPYYLSSDAAYHALHITFDEMLKALEAQYLHHQMISLIQALLQQVLQELPQARGTAIESDALLAADYLAVGLKLLDPQTPLNPELEARIAPQLDQIRAGGGQAPSVLIPRFSDDYSAYKPVGHYAGIPRLEAYFRGMTWFGRVHFKLSPSDPGVSPSRAPLILTQALRRAQIDEQSAAQVWADLNSLLTLMTGLSDDSGPREYALLIDEVYGNGAVLQTLADEGLWQSFLERKNELPSPQINSTFAVTLSQLETEKGWRFLGQRFTLDGLILQNLIFDKVGTEQNPRRFPSGLDILAAFGSLQALRILEEVGETNYDNYLAQMEKMQRVVQSQVIEEWLSTFYNAWLYAFYPQVTPYTVQSREGLPPFMQTEAWVYKDMNSVLGSWAELKHDTVLYAKMPESAGGGGPPMSGPAPAYIEPHPDTFYRLGYAARAMGAILDGKINNEGMLLDEPLPEDYLPNGLPSYVSGLLELGEKYVQLGDLAAKELAGESLAPEEYELIQSCLGPVECLVFRSHTPYGIGEVEAPPVPVVAAISGYGEEILQVAVSEVDRIYVATILEGKIWIAQGGVFAYHEFSRSRTERLTDDGWRALLAANPQPQPSWRGRFALAGGEPVQVLAFRIGDIYIITAAGNKLNVRQEPSLRAEVLTQLETDTYVEISAGPVFAEGYTWWKLRDTWDGNDLGWAVEDQTWYKRSTILE